MSRKVLPSKRRRRPRRLPFSTPAWVTRRPLAGRFALPNVIWKQQLKPAEFMILSCVYYWHSQRLGSSNQAAKLIAGRVHLSEETVKKHLAALTGKGLITSEFSFTPAIPVQPDGHFFSLPDELFTVVVLPPCAFVVYAYLLYVEDRRTRKCHPSIRTIAAGTGLSIKTVEKHIGSLVDKGLILAEGTSYFDGTGKKRTGNNEYTILALCHGAPF